MQKIRTFLWFNNQAEEAANFYVSIFSNSRVAEVTRMNEVDPPLMVEFELDGQRYLAMNGGPDHPFTDAISLLISTGDQEETDRIWNALVEGGKPVACGWLQDKYGLCWQVIPVRLTELMSDPNKAKAGAVMQEMMTQVKIDIAALEAAYNNA